MMKSISNFQFPISNFRKPIFFVFLFFLLLFLFPISYFLSPTSSVLAHDSGKNNDFWTPGDRIVPCINDCNKCELLHLSRHVIDFLMVAATPILATFFLIWAGVLIMMGGANPGMLSSGKRIFKDTIIGVLIVLLSWLIVNTLIKSLAKDVIPGGACVNNVCTNGVGPCNVDDDCGPATYNWWQFSCSQAPGSGNPPPGQPPPQTGRCVLASNGVFRNPTKNSYSNGERITIAVVEDTGYVGNCHNFTVEIRVGSSTGLLGAIDWNSGVVVGSPSMIACPSWIVGGSNKNCGVAIWAANKFNSGTNRYGIRAVAGDGSGGSTEAFSPTFTISP